MSETEEATSSATAVDGGRSTTVRASHRRERVAPATGLPRVGRWDRWIRRLRGMVVHTTLWFGILVLLGTVFAAAVDAKRPGAGESAFVTFIWALGIVLLCGAPAVIAICFAQLTRGTPRSHRRLLSDERVLGLMGRSDGFRDGERMGLALSNVRRVWEHEVAQVEDTSARFTQHATFYGFFSVVALSCTTHLLIGPLIDRTIEAVGQPHRVPVAIAVMTAVTIVFARDVGRMLVRAARRDSSTQMIAWSTKRMIVIATGTVLLSCMAVAGGLQSTTLRGSAMWVLLGAAVAVLGDKAAVSIDDRVARLFGMSASRRLDGVSLAVVDGLGEEDVTRLAEEGIDSVHALALFPTPKLYFNTPYSLERICDWQDQCLLYARIGEAKARTFREQFHVRGAVDAQRLAAGLLAADGEERDDILKILGLGSIAHARVVLERLANDEVALGLAIYRRVLPSAADETERDAATA